MARILIPFLLLAFVGCQSAAPQAAANTTCKCGPSCDPEACAGSCGDETCAELARAANEE